MSISALADCNWGASLTALDFTMCHYVNDDCLQPLVEYCVNVQWLSLSRTHITDYGILIGTNHSKRGLKKLDLLNLTGTSITESSLPAIYTTFCKLTKVLTNIDRQQFNF
jgi:hypothetical protein